MCVHLATSVSTSRFVDGREVLDFLESGGEDGDVDREEESRRGRWGSERDSVRWCIVNIRWVVEEVKHVMYLRGLFWV